MSELISVNASHLVYHVTEAAVAYCLNHLCIDISSIEETGAPSPPPQCLIAEMTPS